MFITRIKITCTNLWISQLTIKYVEFELQVRVRGPGFDTQSGNILLFLLLLFQEGQLSVTGESVHEVLVNCLGGLSLPRKSVVRLTDHPDMTLDVYRGRKTTIQQLVR